ncbi:MAG: sigma-70 factor domain-containing protein, partial [Actinomycetes bacterium]
MAAADSATRIDPSVDDTTGSAPARRPGKRSGAPAKTGTARPRAAGPAKTKSGAKGKTAGKPADSSDEPTDLDAETELDGTPEVGELEEVDVELDTDIGGEDVAEAADDEDDEDDDEEPANTGANRRAPTTRSSQQKGDFVWDEEESEALRQARKDAELTASADSVRAYLKQIGKVALLNAEEEVELAKRIEAGLYAAERMRRSIDAGEKVSPQMRRDLRWIVRDGERAKNHLLEANLRLVVSLAKRYT